MLALQRMSEPLRHCERSVAIHAVILSKAKNLEYKILHCVFRIDNNTEVWIATPAARNDRKLVPQQYHYMETILCTT
jgi:hypothetical protein